jgi:hypothetical protein
MGIHVTKEGKFWGEFAPFRCHQRGDWWTVVVDYIACLSKINHCEQ